MTKKFRLSLLAASLLSLSVPASAAGLGKLTVLSALGQPLRAEIEVTATPEEVGSLNASVASADVFRQANIEYISALTGIRFSLEKRGNDRYYFKMVSDRALNEPFVDVLVQLTWGSGRMVREYTFLLDPVESVASDGASVAAPVVTAPTVAPPAAPRTEAVLPPPAPVARVEPIIQKAPSPAAAASATADRVGHIVKPGDTLSAVARGQMDGSINLDQMLVAMFRDNPDAFDGKNMNRLRVGKLLATPDLTAVEAIPAGVAHREVVAQARDFNEYRGRLADAAASGTARSSTSTPTQKAEGKLAPSVKETRPTDTGDRLKVSREAPNTTAAADLANKVAKEKAMAEAKSRLAELEKNITDLRKLSELKSKNAAKSETAKPAAATAVPAPAISTHAASVEPAAPKMPIKPAIPAAVPPAQAEPSSFLEENLPLLAGGGGILALLVAYFGIKGARRRRQAQEIKAFSEEDFGGRLGADDYHQEDDTYGLSSSFGPNESADAVVTGNVGEGVDPVREADTYIAYGRDAQAEEILLQAARDMPSNTTVCSRLLDIYAGQQSTEKFVTTAVQLHALTDGKGEEWNRAAQQGLLLDPHNPLFGGQPAASAPEPEPAAESASVLDMDLSDAGDLAEPEEVVGGEVSNAMDFDIDPLVAEPAMDVPVPAFGNDIDFEVLPLEEPATSTEEAAISSSFDEIPALDFAVTDDKLDALAPAAEEEKAELADFDFDIGPLTEEPAPAPGIDFSAINLDLDDVPDVSEPVAPASANEVGESDNPEVATKLELALAYDEMGDVEGARELLQEVLSEGNKTQQALAQERLAKFS